MKYLKFLICILIFFLIGAGDQISNKDYLIRALLHFNEGSGTITKDELNSSLSLSGGSWVDGVIGKQIYYDGSSYAASASSVYQPANNFTIMFWFKADSVSGVKQPIDCRPSEAVSSYCFIFINDARLRFLCSGWWYPGGLVSDNALVINTLYFITVTYENGSQKMYVNGILQSVKGTYSGDISYGGGSEFRIGIGKSGYPFAGHVDEVIFYNRVLSKGEIQSIYSKITKGKKRNAQ